MKATYIILNLHRPATIGREVVFKLAPSHTHIIVINYSDQLQYIPDNCLELKSNKSKIQPKLKMFRKASTFLVVHITSWTKSPYDYGTTISTLGSVYAHHYY